MYTLDMYPELYTLNNLENRKNQNRFREANSSLKHIDPKDIQLSIDKNSGILTVQGKMQYRCGRFLTFNENRNLPEFVIKQNLYHGVKCNIVQGRIKIELPDNQKTTTILKTPYKLRLSSSLSKSYYLSGGKISGKDSQLDSSSYNTYNSSQNGPTGQLIAPQITSNNNTATTNYGGYDRLSKQQIKERNVTTPLTIDLPTEEVKENVLPNHIKMSAKEDTSQRKLNNQVNKCITNAFKDKNKRDNDNNSSMQPTRNNSVNNDDGIINSGNNNVCDPPNRQESTMVNIDQSMTLSGNFDGTTLTMSKNVESKTTPRQASVSSPHLSQTMNGMNIADMRVSPIPPFDFSKSNSQSPIYSPIPPYLEENSINYTAQVSPLPDNNSIGLDTIAVTSQIQNALLQVQQFQQMHNMQQENVSVPHSNLLSSLITSQTELMNASTQSKESHESLGRTLSSSAKHFIPAVTNPSVVKQEYIPSPKSSTKFKKKSNNYNNKKVYRTYINKNDSSPSFAQNASMSNGVSNNNFNKNNNNKRHSYNNTKSSNHNQS